MAKEKIYTINDLKKANNEIFDLFKEIRKEAKINRNKIVLEALDKVSLELDYRSVLFQSLKPLDIANILKLTELIKKGLFDAQELLRRGTEYGVKLALDRIKTLHKDRTINKSPFLVEKYCEFEENLWKIIKLRELAYGEIVRLRKKQDDITKTALTESDPMMRVRYFEDIRVLESDILRLEKEAHNYDVVHTALHNEKVLKNVVQQYAVDKEDVLSLETFENTVKKYNRGNN